MPRRPNSHLTELELMIMQAIWKQGDATVESIREALTQNGRSLALPSIRTMLGILQEKGYLTRHSEGRKHIYQALVSQDNAQTSMLKEVVDNLFEGSAQSLVAALLNNELVSSKEIEQVKTMLKQPSKKQR